MEKVIFSLVYFVIIFCISLILFLFINRKRKTIKTGKIHMDINYLITCGNLDMTKTSYKTVKKCTTIIDSFVIAFSCAVLVHFDSFVWKIIVGFVVLSFLLYSLFTIVGRMLKKRELKK